MVSEVTSVKRSMVQQHQIVSPGSMIYVGIDVAKDKHDCFIMDFEGTVRADVFTIPNSMDGFDTLLRIHSCSTPQRKVGLEATEHYSCNILGFLLDNGLSLYYIPPFFFRKATENAKK